MMRQLSTDKAKEPSSRLVDHGPRFSTRANVTAGLEQPQTEKAKRALKTWKPITLKPPLLLTLAALSACSIVVLQVLLSKSQRDGGIIFAPTIKDFSVGTTFFYLYLPVLIAVLYSMLWAWIDLDAKRLEPYFQMSSTNGASAEDSLLLHYPFDFLATVPIKAAKRGHWAVLCASLATVIVVWGITPLTGAVFDISMVDRSYTAPVVFGSLLSSAQQVDALNANFFNDAYAILWLNASLPAYTSHDIALHPFYLAEPTIGNPSSGTLTVNTTAYFTNLTCNPAIVHDETSEKPLCSSGRGCSTSLQLLGGGGQFFLQYTGWYSSAWSNFALSMGECPNAFSNTFLAFWINREHQEGYLPLKGKNYSLNFCEANYYSQQVEATVSLPSYAVLSVSPISEAETLSLSIFNATNFNYLLSTAVAALSESDTGEGGGFGTSGADIPDMTIMDQTERLRNLSVSTADIPDVSAYAFGVNSIPIAEFHDLTVLTRALQGAHQLLFSTALGRISLTEERTGDMYQGNRTVKLAAVTVDRNFTILTQISFATASGLTVVLLLLNFRRGLNLCQDPSSIARIMGLIAGNGQIVDFLDKIHVHSKASASTMLHSVRFKMALKGSGAPKIELLNLQQQVEYGMKSGEQNDEAKQIRSMLRHVELKRSTGCLWLLLHVGLLATLAALHVQMQAHNGLSLPSQNQFVRNLVLSYLPIAISMFLEPVWVLLNRTRGMLQPFQSLIRGNASINKSIGAKYTSLPPQMIIFRAIKAGHLVLASVCAVAILANVLAVSFSELFETLPETLQSEYQYGQSHQAMFIGADRNVTGISGSPYTLTLQSNYSYYDYLYILKEKINKNATLPQWTAEEFMFLPFVARAKTDYHVNSTRDATTRGFGIDMQCYSTGITYTEHGEEHLSLSVPFRTRNGSTTVVHRAKDLGFYGDLQAQDLRTIPAAAEFVDNNPPNDVPGFSAGWLRNAVLYNRTQLMLIGCQPLLRSATFNVTVNKDSRIISFARVTDYEYDLEKYFAKDQSAQNVIAEALLIFFTSKTGTYWHTDAFAGDWMNYLVKSSMRSAAIVDPYSAIPHVDIVAPIIESIFNQFFAIYLGLNLQWFEAAAPGEPTLVSGTMSWTEDRVFFTKTAFLLGVIILAVDIIVAAAFYTKRPKKVLPDLPTSLASIMSLVGHSHALNNVELDNDELQDIRYGYGKFIGTDGKPHIGIERSSHVVSISERDTGSRTSKQCC